MATHQFNKASPSDDFFVPGELKFLVAGNVCRLMDRRRTPGTVISVNVTEGFFRWEISDFEDKGKYWDVAIDRANTYQFKRGSLELEANQVERIETRLKDLDKVVDISIDAAERKQTCEDLKGQEEAIATWFQDNSTFFKPHVNLDFQTRTGPAELRADFNSYLKSVGLEKIERQTADIQVMNPHSGDWIKALHIVMAEMGLKAYKGKQIRASSVFVGLGSREKRRAYIIHRLAFLRAVFRKLGLSEIEVYRGMSTEWNWQPDTDNQYRFWSSWTFNHQVAQDFSNLSPGTKHKNSYLIKRAIPIEKVFMTFLETDAMNRQYLEAEAIILHDDADRMIW